MGGGGTRGRDPAQPKLRLQPEARKNPKHERKGGEKPVPKNPHPAWRSWRGIPRVPAAHPRPPHAEPTHTACDRLATRNTSPTAPSANQRQKSQRRQRRTEEGGTDPTPNAQKSLATERSPHPTPNAKRPPPRAPRRTGKKNQGERRRYRGQRPKHPKGSRKKQNDEENESQKDECLMPNYEQAPCGLDTRRALVDRRMSRRGSRYQVHCRRGKLQPGTVRPEWEGATAVPCAAAVQATADRHCSPAAVRRASRRRSGKAAKRRATQAGPTKPMAEAAAAVARSQTGQAHIIISSKAHHRIISGASSDHQRRNGGAAAARGTTTAGAVAAKLPCALAGC